MRYARNWLRALGLSSLAVLGLMAFAAMSAQGQATGKFLDANGELAVGTTFGGVQESTGSLLVPALGIAIQCTFGFIEEGKVTAKATETVGGTAHAQIRFLQCITKTSALGSLASCRIGEVESITAKVKLLARLAGAGHLSVPFVLAEPLEGTKFALVVIENATGKFCAVSGDYDATGTLALKVLAGNNNPQLVIPYANQELLGDSGLKLGFHAATLDASITAELTTPPGLVWAPFGVC